MNIRWTEPAVLNLQNIRDFISRDSEYYAIDFTTKIISTPLGSHMISEGVLADPFLSEFIA